MFITPMNGLEGMKGIAGWGEGQQSHSPQTAGADIFRNVFSDAIKNAAQSDQDLAEKQYLLSIGQIDDVHTVPTAAAQAELSLNLLIQLRNKAVDAYNELMRINL